MGSCGYCTCLLTSPSGVFSGSLYKSPKCWPKTNRLPVISPAKMGLFGISRELQFRVCNHGEPHASPHVAREGGGKGSWEAVINKESLCFNWLSSCQDWEDSFFFLLGSAIVAGCGSSLSDLPAPFNWGFCLLIFYRGIIALWPLARGLRLLPCRAWTWMGLCFWGCCYRAWGSGWQMLCTVPDSASSLRASELRGGGGSLACSESTAG